MVDNGYLNTANLTGTIRWAIENDKEAQKIAQNGMEFVSQYLTMDGAYCYWREVLSRLAKLQAPGMALPADAEEFDPKIHTYHMGSVITAA